jgi:hypothetical protein
MAGESSSPAQFSSDGTHQALSWLEQGFQERANWLTYIRADPLLKPLHGTPRFEALAEKIVPARLFAKAATTSR